MFLKLHSYIILFNNNNMRRFCGYLNLIILSIVDHKKIFKIIRSIEIIIIKEGVESALSIFYG